MEEGSGPSGALPSQTVAQPDALLAHPLLGRGGVVPRAAAEAGPGLVSSTLSNLAAAEELVGLGLLGAGVDETPKLHARPGEVPAGVLHQAGVLVPEAERRIG